MFKFAAITLLLCIAALAQRGPGPPPSNSSTGVGAANVIAETAGLSTEADFVADYIGVVGNSAAVTITMPNMGYYGPRYNVGKILIVKDEACTGATKNITVIANGNFSGVAQTGQSTIDGLYLTGPVITTNCGFMSLMYIGSNSWATVGKQ